jgi:cytochrome c oxidase cbb3-type subunit IV
MFRFIKKYAETMQGVDIYPIISLFIFVIFFVTLLVFVKKMDKKVVQHISNIPLDNETITSIIN